MKDRYGRIIYVGKAKKLRNRIRSYFSPVKDKKTSLLIGKIDTIDVVVTDNEYEALILENNLIKEHSPRYNINLKDGKTYPVIRITADEYPRVFRTRNIIKDGSDYFGPFVNLKATDMYLGIIDTLFPLRKCRGRLKKREHPCLYYHIGKCPGPCAGLITRKKYQRQVTRIRNFLSSSPENIKQNIRKSMEKSAKKLNFERASEFRDSLLAIEAMEKDQHVNDFDNEKRDYTAFHEHGGIISFVVFQMRQGKLIGTDIFRSRNFADDGDGSLEQFIMRYYEDIRKPPSVLYVLADTVDFGLLERFFRKHQGAAVRVRAAESDRDRRLLRMAKENARHDSVKRAREIGDEEGITELKKLFKLPGLPRRIEGFDIAHMQGKYTVAALVSFWNGIPDKKNYRYFNMRNTQNKIDDYESMREVIARRYTKLLNEKKTLPDLILLDGGKGQLSAACRILEGIGLKGLPILSLAKQEEEIFLPGHAQGFILPAGSPGLRVLQAVRDEAHRFATSRRAASQSGEIRLQQLEAIPGIGPKRAKRLMEFSGSLDTLAASAVSEIAEACGISKELAQAARDSIRKNFQ